MANRMSARWSFTYNNALPGQTIENLDGSVSYMIYQHELAPETGTRHIQGYVRFANRKRFQSVLAWLAARGCGGAHIEAASGNEKQNHDYCSKLESRAPGGDPVEHGEYEEGAGQQGRRSDLDAATGAIDRGATMAEIARAHPADFVRYHRGFQAYADTTRPLPPVERPVSVFVLWGPTGTGKTHRVMHQFPNAYSVKPGRDPWGMYRQEEVIFFDEFDFEKWTVQDLNRYLDKWRCMLDSRYADKYAMWTSVILAANSNPSSWYPQAAPLLLDALRRRLTGRCFLVESQEPTWEEVVSSPPNPF